MRHSFFEKLGSLNPAALVESARVGADALRTNPTRTVLSTTGVIIGVAALVAAFAITDGVDVWSRQLIMRESSVQDVAITPVTSQVVHGRVFPVRGYPMFDAADAEKARAEIPGVIRSTLMLNGTTPVEYLDMRASAQLTLGTASLADFAGINLVAGRFFTESEVAHASPVIVLGNRLAQELAGARDGLWLIGKTIKAGGSRREVIGVLAAPPSGPEPDLVAFAPIRGGVDLLQTTKSRQVATTESAQHRVGRHAEARRRKLARRAVWDARAEIESRDRNRASPKHERSNAPYEAFAWCARLIDSRRGRNWNHECSARSSCRAYEGNRDQESSGGETA